GALHVDGGGLLTGRVTGDLDAGLDLDAALLEGALHDGGDLGIATREDRGQTLEDGDLGAHVGEHRRELTPDGAATDDRGGGGQCAQVEELVRGQHELAVQIEARQGARY